MWLAHIHTPLQDLVSQSLLAMASTLVSHVNLSKSLNYSTLQFPYLENEDANEYDLYYWFPKSFLKAKWDNTCEILKYYSSDIQSSWYLALSEIVLIHHFWVYCPPTIPLSLLNTTEFGQNTKCMCVRPKGRE